MFFKHCVFSVFPDSLDVWKKDGTRAVWIKVAIEHSSLVPIITEVNIYLLHRTHILGTHNY